MDVGVMKNIENLSPHHYDTNMMVLPVDAQPNVGVDQTANHVKAEESVLNDNGMPDVERIKPILFLIR